MAGRIVGLKDELERALNDNSKPWTSFLASLESKTGVSRVYIFVGCILAVALWLIFGFAGQLVCNFVGFLYPAYVSIHALESPQKEDDTKWLTYWVVFATFSLVEFFADIIVGWFPMYWLCKSLFFVWLMLPTEYNGSLVIYRNLIKPYFLTYHPSIDSVMGKVKTAGEKLL